MSSEGSGNNAITYVAVKSTRTGTLAFTTLLSKSAALRQIRTYDSTDCSSSSRNAKLVLNTASLVFR
jgi:hypothetical protein